MECHCVQCAELFALDFQVNHYPSFTTDSPLDKEIKEVVTLLTKKIYFDDNLSFSKIIFDSVEDFSKNKIQDEFILQLLKFEISMLRISQQNKNNKEPKVLTFDYDMLTYYEHLIKKKEKCKLAFNVTEYGEIKISKVM